MAGRKGFLESETSAVQNICKPFGCVYALVDRCGIKYSEEVVLDFQERDGCQVAAQSAEIGGPFQTIVSVIPGSMTTSGFVPFEAIHTISPSEHKTGIKAERRPSGKLGGRVAFKFSEITPNRARF